MRGLVGKKIGMSRIFDDSGSVVPVTVLQMGPCAVVQIKTKNKDGYNAVQVGYDSVKNNKISKPKINEMTDIATVFALFCIAQNISFE